MKRFTLLVLSLLPVASCAPSAEQSEPGGPVVARVGGEPVHQDELDAWLREDLFEKATAGKDAAGLHEFRRDGLERMIGARLLEDAAASAGLEIEALFERETAGAVVTDADVSEFFDANRERLAGAPFDELAPRIRGYLEQQRRDEAWNAYLSGLREQAGVELLIEVPRIEVAAVGPALGPEGAPVTIVEFSDFNCPYCQRVTPTLKALHTRYPEQVRIVFRHFPLAMHPRARPIAEASVCADEQGSFWAFHDAVFEDPQPLADDAIRALAEGVGLDLGAFEACLADGRAGSVVERDLADGAAAGVTGTPAFFVNGVRMSGAQPLGAFDELIQQELAAAPEGAPSS